MKGGMLYEFAQTVKDPDYKICKDGCPLPPPPCAPYLEDCCSCCCYKISQCGFQYMHQKKVRAPMFIALGWFSVLQFALCIWAAVALTGNGNTLKNCAWTKMTVESGGSKAEIWMGLTHVHLERTIPGTDDFTTTLKWDDVCDCSEGTNPDMMACPFLGDSERSSECNACLESSAGFHTAAIAGILGKLGQLTTDFTRSAMDEDVPCQKVFGMVTGCFSSLLTLVALVQYANTCIRVVPDTILVNGISVPADTHPGIGWVLITICTIMGFPDSFANCLVPCPEDCVDVSYREKRAKGILPSGREVKRDPEDAGL